MSPRVRVYTHASELITGRGVRAHDGRRPVEDHLERIHDGAIALEADGRIGWVGPTRKLPARYLRLGKGSCQSLDREHALIPGLVDAHTHLVFAGDRADEFARRQAGESYESIAKRGGGIAATVRATRGASAAELVRLASERVEAAIQVGVRTLEIKSGYGLDLATELRILAVVRRLQRRRWSVPVTLVPTLLAAHAVPPGQTRAAYLKRVNRELLPEVARRGLAASVDVFCDRGYFSLDDARAHLRQAQRLGLAVRLHADELVNTESVKLGCELGAWSVDHCLCVSQAGIRALGRSRRTVAVLLPGTALYLNKPQAPARRLIDAGAAVAIATDFNPGTCMTQHLPAIMTLAAVQLRMSAAEIFAAVTYNAAKALGLEHDRATLEVGRRGDLFVAPFARFEDLYYRFAWLPAANQRSKSP